MSEKYKFDDPDGMYFVTSTVVGWVDLFTRPQLKRIVVDSLRFCQVNKGLLIHAWCLMPSHLHLIASTLGPPLSSILRDFKKFTSSALIKEVKSPYESRREWLLELFGKAAEHQERVWNYKVWQDGNHPELLFRKGFRRQKLNYLHDNPVVAEIVDKPEDYLYSSARDYYTKVKGLLEVSLI
jgi:REP element-mobilizing transposase RayT